MYTIFIAAPHELLDVVAAGQPIVSQDIAVIPQFLDQCRRSHGLLQLARRSSPSEGG
jgi:hypothetical protein